MEKATARRSTGDQARGQARQALKGKAGKVARPSTPPKAAKVIKVVPPAKKERTSTRPPAPAALPKITSVSRVEPVRLHNSEHGAAISRTDHLKARFAALSGAVTQIKALKRGLGKNFFEIGALLEKIRAEKLYEVKGYGSFESFVEREIDIDKLTCSRLARVSRVFVRDAVLEAGLERACAAIVALDGDAAAPTVATQSYPVSSTVSSALPAHKR